MKTRRARKNLMYAGGNNLISSARMLMALLLTTLVLAATCRLADAANTAVAYVTGSTEKICQLTGDYDNDINFQKPTANLTNTRYGVLGVDLGVSFRHNGKTYFLFGDTENAGSNDCVDSVAYTTDTNPADGLSLTFINNSGTFIPPTVGGESLGCMGVPMEGISTSPSGSGGTMYVYFTKDGMAGSFLAKCTNESSLNFTKVYDLSSDKFKNVQVESVNTAIKTAYNQYLPAADQNKTILFVWGSGAYRASNPYLAYMVFSDIETKSKLRYFKGIDASNKPIWSATAAETEAQPLFSQACIGEFSVTWNPFLNKWLMLFNCGTPRGINYRVADYPWGPWSETELLFDPGADKDHGYCYFMHTYDCPTAGSGCDDNYDNLQSGGACRWGGEYGPYVISDFTTGVAGQSTTIYFTLSTWNPYQVVLMESTLQMVPPIAVTSPAAGDNLAVNATKTVRWTATGIAGNVKIELGRPLGCGYSWSTITSSTAASSESFSFTVPGPAQENCIIRVTSLTNTSIYGDSGAFDIVAANRAPIAGSVTVSPSSVYRGQKYYSLSATGFSDPDGDTLTYAWGVLNPGATSVYWWTGSGPSSYTNQTAPSDLGDYKFYCYAIDPSGAKSAEKTATLTVYNRAPTVGSITISPNPANRGQSFTVCASASDPDGDALTYWWGWQNPGSSTVTWWQGTSCFSSTAPTTAGAYTIHCIAQDSYGAQSPEKTATLTVK